MTTDSPSLLTRALARLRDTVLQFAFFILEYLLPKKSTYWCFCTWNNAYPHTLDNPRGVFEEIKADPTIRKIILLKPYHSADPAVTDGSNVTFTNVESLLGAYLFARAKVLILGYGLRGVSSYSRHITRRHHIVQLWHGIPLKRIGKLFPGETFWDAETPSYFATICSAQRDQEIMTAAFAPTPNVWLSGLPRNDLILKPESQLPQDYRRQLDDFRARLAGRKFVLYAPTWRDNNSGIYAFSPSELDTLKNFLTSHNAVMGVRAHANRRTLTNSLDAADDTSPIFIANDIPDVNILLRATDVLVTDYSSIYIDFLLTGRPILNFTYDVDTYMAERGFLYDLREATPSSPFRTFAELISQLDTAITGTILDAPRYERVTALFHAHPDHPSSVIASLIRAHSEQ